MKTALFMSWIVLMTVAALPVEVAAQTIYKWTDEQGTVHYGERPPQGVDAQPVRTAKPREMVGDNPYAQPERAEGELSVAEQRRQDRAAKRKIAEDNAARTEAECTAQRDILARIEPRPNVIIQKPDGTTSRMDDAERVKMIDDAKKFIAENCED